MMFSHFFLLSLLKVNRTSLCSSTLSLGEDCGIDILHYIGTELELVELKHFFLMFNLMFKKQLCGM